MFHAHTYCCVLGLEICDGTGEPRPQDGPECAKWHKQIADWRTKDSERLGVPYFLSEFGACTNSSLCAREITQAADENDAHLHSGWAYWQFKRNKEITSSAFTSAEGFYNDDGSLQELKIKAISRTYIKAGQGDIKSVNFSQDGRFSGSVQIDTKIDHPTVVHVFRSGKGISWYPHGLDVVLTGKAGEDKSTTFEIVDNEVRIMVSNKELNG